MIRDREYLEREEDQRLAPYAVRSINSAGREHPEPPPVHRTQFQRDWHRITHSRAFRKLEFKTQVFIYGEGTDFSRNRLTHTLEVAQITTSICRALGLNEDLGQAIALGHDLGHTPFGHAGEEKLRELVKAFNHNHHGLRIVRELERRYPDFPGLNLTLETLEGLEKHETDFDLVTRHTFFKGKMPTLEAQVASLADSIAYRSHDVEDGLYTRIISPDQLREAGLRLWEMVSERVGPEEKFPGPRSAWLAQVSRHLINIYISDVIAETSRLLEEAKVESLAGVRDHQGSLVRMSEELRRADEELGSFLHEQFYRDFRVVRMAKKGQMIVEKLYHAFTRDPELLPGEWRRRYEDATLGRIEDEPTRVIADYIAGMTDRYAIREYRRIFEV